MLRRLFVLLLILATLVALVLYAWKYSAQKGVPENDPVRRLMESVRIVAPAWVPALLDEALGVVESQIVDIRWSFLAIFAIFYVQLSIARRPPPRNEREIEARKRKRVRAFAGQVKVLFFATLLIGVLIFGVEILARYGKDTVTILGIEIRRGNAQDFQRNVYHYGLLLAVAHLLGFLLFTWVILALAARRARARATKPAE